MTWLLVLAILVVAIVLYLFAAPFYIEVDSVRGICRVRFQWGAQARIYVTEESMFTELRFLGWRKQIDLLAGTGKQERMKKRSAERKEKKKVLMSMRKMRAIIGSFKLSKCRVSIDTGDVVLNGLLYPWFLWIGLSIGKDVRINFYNENEVTFEIQNNFFRVVQAYVFH